MRAKSSTLVYKFTGGVAEKNKLPMEYVAWIEPATNTGWKIQAGLFHTMEEK